MIYFIDNKFKIIFFSLCDTYNEALRNYYKNNDFVKILDKINISEYDDYEFYYIWLDQKYLIIKELLKLLNDKNSISENIITEDNCLDILNDTISNINIESQYKIINYDIIQKNFYILNLDIVNKIFKYYYKKEINLNFSNKNMIISCLNKYFNLNLLKDQIKNSKLDSQFYETYLYVKKKIKKEYNPNKINKIYYINLDHRLDRKNHIENVLSKIDINNIERFNAVKLNKHDLNHKNAIYYKYFKRGIVRFKQYLNSRKFYDLKKGVGVYGCYLSHYFLLQDIQRKFKKNELVLILEDDADFDQNLINNCEDLIKREFIEQNINWDIIRVIWGNPYDKMNKINDQLFTYTNCNSQSKFADENNSNNMHNGTTFQIINTKNIKRILNYLEKDYIYNIDGVYCTNKIDIFVYRYGNNITAEFSSDIRD